MVPSNGGKVSTLTRRPTSFDNSSPVGRTVESQEFGDVRSVVADSAVTGVGVADPSMSLAQPVRTPTALKASAQSAVRVLVILQS